MCVILRTGRRIVGLRAEMMRKFGTEILLLQTLIISYILYRLAREIGTSRAGLGPSLLVLRTSSAKLSPPSASSLPTPSSHFSIPSTA